MTATFLKFPHVLHHTHVYFSPNFSFQEMRKHESGKGPLRNKILGEFCSVSLRKNHNRAREKKVWSDKGQNFRVMTMEGIGLPREAVCIQIWVGFIWEQNHRKKGLSPDSAHHINFHHLPTRPDQPPAPPWQEELGIRESWPRKEGFTCPPHVHIFFLCREALESQPWHSSHLGNRKALFPSHRVSTLYRRDKHFQHQLFSL